MEAQAGDHAIRRKSVSLTNHNGGKMRWKQNLFNFISSRRNAQGGGKLMKIGSLCDWVGEENDEIWLGFFTSRENGGELSCAM